jgi:hypothetical protein
MCSAVETFAKPAAGGGGALDGPEHATSITHNAGFHMGASVPAHVCRGDVSL